MGGKSSLRTRRAALDSLFSEWVRRRHADKQGYAICVTCWIRGHWKTMQAGHFWKRQHQATRYDPMNVHGQCVRCNNYRGGAEAEHATYILKTYGLEAFEDLEKRHSQVKKWTRDEIESLISYYKTKVSELDS